MGAQEGTETAVHDLYVLTEVYWRAAVALAALQGNLGALVHLDIAKSLAKRRLWCQSQNMLYWVTPVLQPLVKAVEVTRIRSYTTRHRRLNAIFGE